MYKHIQSLNYIALLANNLIKFIYEEAGFLLWLLFSQMMSFFWDSLLNSVITRRPLIKVIVGQTEDYRGGSGAETWKGRPCPNIRSTEKCQLGSSSVPLL